MLVVEELWQNPGIPGLIVVTCNGTLARDGSLVMGRGAAREAKRRINGIQYEAGKIARGFIPVASHTGYSHYGFAIVRPPTEEKIGFGIFQVKWHFSEDADLDLIQISTNRMLDYVEQHPYLNVRMNFPGIGNGRLSEKDVLPIIKPLDEWGVTICKRSSK